jgi:hypothetical protein
MDQPARFEDPDKAVKALELLRRPAGTASGHTTVNEVKPAAKESYAPSPSYLDPDYFWVFPALAYCMVGIDKSLFSLYTWNTGVELDVTTYLTETPICVFENIDISKNRWFYTVQGIPMEYSKDFTYFVESFVFKHDLRNEHWSLSVQQERCADPFASSLLERTGTYINILLPTCTTKNLQVSISKSSGLQLTEPVLSIMPMKKSAHAVTKK